MKIKKLGKHFTNLHGKSEYVIHIRKLKQALNHEYVFKKFGRMMKFNQKTWLKPYIDMHTN